MASTGSTRTTPPMTGAGPWCAAGTRRHGEPGGHGVLVEDVSTSMISAPRDSNAPRARSQNAALCVDGCVASVGDHAILAGREGCRGRPAGGSGRGSARRSVGRPDDSVECAITCSYGAPWGLGRQIEPSAGSMPPPDSPKRGLDAERPHTTRDPDEPPPLTRWRAHHPAATPQRAARRPAGVCSRFHGFFVRP